MSIFRITLSPDKLCSVFLAPLCFLYLSSNFFFNQLLFFQFYVKNIFIITFQNPIVTLQDRVYTEINKQVLTIYLLRRYMYRLVGEPSPSTEDLLHVKYLVI